MKEIKTGWTESTLFVAARRTATLFLFGFFISMDARASDEQRFIGFECQPERQMLRVSYHSDHLHALFNEGYLVDTFYLKKNDPSGEYVESVREVTKECRINRVKYVVRLRGVPGAGRLNANCGGATYGGVVIHRNGAKIVDIQFEQCSGGPITTAITLKDGGNKPTIDTDANVKFQ